MTLTNKRLISKTRKLTIKEFNNLTTTYNLWINEDALLVYARFRRCVRGDTRDTWDTIIADSPGQSRVIFETQLDL